MGGSEEGARVGEAQLATAHRRATRQTHCHRGGASRSVETAPAVGVGRRKGGVKIELNRSADGRREGPVGGGVRGGVVRGCRRERERRVRCGATQ